ncbi:LLM class flavin-dependent oxidoreductase [Planotetraspora kaengkrachanensis]|uniref:FMNH2-utilizing oxygenase n=1 Tax=Planotetraspora kaengkrachanensis TaxID=575193 RepID=A0A8J3LYA5_9ACTN|nr:LLM class flavin-dependent oxidoreductase [Planotetraspora kaengkrachanensis]GIG78965.1 FMNH2-utilizing oxygenase [Planotetraspora kaengkrachanensis]
MNLHLAAALDGAGGHPAAWRAPGLRPDVPFSAGYWVRLVKEAEQGLLDYVTFGGPEAGPGWSAESSRDGSGWSRGSGHGRGAPDPTLIATEVAPLSSRIGLIPATGAIAGRHDHVAHAIATLDRLSNGRAGWHPGVSGGPGEASGVVNEVRRSWDGFPDGQPPVISLARGPAPYEFAARSCDVVHVTPRDWLDATMIVDEVRAAERAAGRTGARLKIFADLVVFLDLHPGVAAGRKARLDDFDGVEFTSDALVYAGTPTGLVGLMLDWRSAGLDGFRLHPGVLTHDLSMIVRGLVPELQARGVFRHRYGTAGLRARLGLPRPDGQAGDDPRPPRPARRRWTMP